MTSICLHSLTLTALETRKLIASLMLNITNDLVNFLLCTNPIIYTFPRFAVLSFRATAT